MLECRICGGTLPPYANACPHCQELVPRAGGDSSPVGESARIAHCSYCQTPIHEENFCPCCGALAAIVTVKKE